MCRVLRTELFELRCSVSLWLNSLKRSLFASLDGAHTTPLWLNLYEHSWPLLAKLTLLLCLRWIFDSSSVNFVHRDQLCWYWSAKLTSVSEANTDWINELSLRLNIADSIFTSEARTGQLRWPLSAELILTESKVLSHRLNSLIQLVSALLIEVSEADQYELRS